MADRFMKIARATASSELGDLPVGRVVRVNEPTANRWKDLGIATDSSEREFDLYQQQAQSVRDAERNRVLATASDARGQPRSAAVDADALAIRDPLVVAEIERRYAERMGLTSTAEGTPPGSPELAPSPEGEEVSSSGRRR